MTLERAGTTIIIRDVPGIIRDVPGEICDTCGEVYHRQEVTSILLKQAEQAYRDGVDIEVRRYRKAA